MRWLQTALNKVDNAGLAVDGQFGSGTTTAVKNFQAKHGLTQDGQAGTSTINKLVEIFLGEHTFADETLLLPVFPPIDNKDSPVPE